ncbi:MAG: FIST N-terminal domain-containing protein, partial [Campylobacterota bacterium]|nr:FIST N-terminal domain-containing protein [Campylobacterota bacterium]
DKELLENELNNSGIDLSSDKILIQLFTSVLDLKKIEKTLVEVLSILPNATLIGSTTAGEIYEGSMLDGASVLSISIFEKSTIQSCFSIEDSTYSLGKKIAQNLFCDESRCIISFIDGLNHNGDEFLQALSSENKNHIPIAGGMSGDNQMFSNTYTFYQDKVFSGGGVGVSLNGDSLEVFQDYNLGWRAVGPKFTITKSVKNRVYEINNRPIIEIYTEVLGKDIVDEIPASTVEFPLIKKVANTLIARSMVAKLEDDSIIFAGDLNEGDEVQFSIGSANLVNQYTPSKLVKSHLVDIQASFIYSCSARKQFLGTNLEYVFKKISDISPTAGFFTYGEFYYSQNVSSLLNITTTVLFLNEIDSKHNKNNTKKLLETQDSSLSDRGTLHLIDYITKELEEKEKRVEFSEKLLKEYLNGINLSLIISKTDKYGIIKYTNSKFEEISGYKNSELIGKNHNIVRHPDVSSDVFKDIWKTLVKGNIWSGSFPNLKKDGSTYYVSSSIIPIHGRDGEIFEYMAIREDITSLQEARVKAEKAEAIQAMFLANMSHEIRTPMNGILGFSELLLNSNLDETQKNYVDIINSSANGLLGIINDILDFSKLQNEKVEIEKIPVDTIYEFNNLFELLRSIADNKSIKYTKNFDENISKCLLCDPTRIKQVLTNLISNAIKFTPDFGQVEFIVDVIKTTNSTQKILFKIKDSGIGIAKDKQKLIFVAFSQADSSTTREFGGTGLGLSISKGFVDTMGGELKVNSTLGEGSEFSFELEFDICDEKDLSKRSEKRKKVSIEKLISKEKLSVLVAEGYDINRILIETLLSNYGVKVTFALNGVEVVEKVSSNKYDMIFMDINMPVMNGVEATKIIRKNGIKTPIIGLS